VPTRRSMLIAASNAKAPAAADRSRLRQGSRGSKGSKGSDR
jgi:hypothetical protein